VELGGKGETEEGKRRVVRVRDDDVEGVGGGEGGRGGRKGRVWKNGMASVEVEGGRERGSKGGV